MADDEVAKTSLVFDASGAQKGAADFKAAADQVIAADAAVGQSADKAADTVTKAETKKSTARRSSAQASAESSRNEIAAAAAAGDAAVAATDRVATSYSRQTSFLNQMARQLDPLGSAAKTASDKLQSLLDIIAKGGPNTERAASMVEQATLRLVAAQQAISGTGNRLADIARLTNIFDPATASAQRMTAELADLNKAQQLGITIAGGYSNAWDNIVAKYDDGIQAAQKAAAAQKTMIDQARASQDAENAQTSFNKVLGVPDPQQRQIDHAANAQSAAVFEAEFAANEKLLAERKALETELNPIKTASLAYADALTRVQRAVELGVISEKQGEVQTARMTAEFAAANAPLSGLNAKLKEHGEVNGQAAFAQRQLAVQSVQFFSSIQGGSPILLALIQQGHQIIDVAFATGTGFGVLGDAIKKGFGYLLSPIGLMVAAVAGLAALAIGAESTARRLGNLRNELGGVRDDAAAAVQMSEDAVRHLAATTSISTTDARTGTAGLLNSREFQGTQQQLEDLVVAADKLSIRLGVALPASIDIFKKAMKDPAAAAQELADKQLTGFDTTLVDSIKLLEEAGHKADAFNLFLAAVRANAGGVTREITPLQKALAALNESLVGTEKGGKSLADTLGGVIAGAAAHAINGITAVINAIKELRSLTLDLEKWLEDHLPGGHSQVMPTPATPGGARPGGTVINNDDAIGMFQLRRPAAADVGISPDRRFDYNANIAGGVSYFRKQYDATGNIDDATRAYNQGLGGAQKGLGGDYLASVQKQNVANLPAQSKADIEAAFLGIFSDIASTANAPAIRDRIMQIALQESGGQHYGPAPRTPGEGAQTGRGTSSSAPLNVTPSGVVDADLVGDAVKKADTMGTTEAARSKALADIQNFQLALAKLRSENKEGTPEFAKLTQALEASQLAFVNAIPPADKLTQTLDRQKTGQERIAAAYGQGSAAVARVTAEVKAEEEARNLAAVGTQKYAEIVADLTKKYLANDDAQQKTALGKKVQEMDLEVAAQNRLNDAYAKGQALQVTAATKAEADARVLALAGLVNEADATKVLTAANIALAQSKARAPFEKQIATNDNQIVLLNAEAGALGMNNEARTIYLAKLQEEMALKQAELPIDDEAAKRYIASAQNIAKATLDLSNQKQALADIAGQFSQSFDTIGNAITQSLLSGTGAAVNWKNVMTSVAQQVLQQFLKLAVLNPLLNKMFGQNLTTWDKAIDALNKSSSAPNIPGSTTTDSSSSGGMLGSILGIVGKLGGLVGGIGGDAAGMGFGAGAGALTAGADPSFDLVTTPGAPSYTASGEWHKGGLVGFEPSFTRMLDQSIIDRAPRFHAGLGANEFAAILEKGERVLTGRQQQQVAAAANNNSAGQPVINFHFPPNTQPDNFRRAGQQVAAQVQGALARSKARNG